MGLTTENVLSIKRGLRDGKKYKELAEEYGVTEATIGHIKTGHTWSKVRLPEDDDFFTKGEDTASIKAQAEKASPAATDEMRAKKHGGTPVRGPRKATMDVEITPDGDVTIPSKGTQVERIHNGVDNIKEQKALTTIKLLGKKNEELEARLKELEERVAVERNVINTYASRVEHMGISFEDLDKQVTALQALAENKRDAAGQSDNSLADAIVALAIGDKAGVHQFIHRYMEMA